jgi:hypothetical protein
MCHLNPRCQGSWRSLEQHQKTQKKNKITALTGAKSKLDTREKIGRQVHCPENSIVVHE